MLDFKVKCQRGKFYSPLKSQSSSSGLNTKPKQTELAPDFGVVGHLQLRERSSLLGI